MHTTQPHRKAVDMDIETVLSAARNRLSLGTWGTQSVLSGDELVV